MDLNVSRSKVQFVKIGDKTQAAPDQQLLITEHVVTEIANKIFVKKSQIVNPEVITSLRHLCKINEKYGNDPKRQLAIILMRKEILENASEIYFEGDVDQLFTETSDELDIINELLNKCTITR